jgi:glucans biosynthesis protein
MRGNAGGHQRNTGPMRDSPRCGAQTRKGTLCQSPAVSGKARCRMHGGAKGSGAPRGNTNALKHGMYTKTFLEEQKELRSMIREMQESLQKIDGG